MTNIQASEASFFNRGSNNVPVTDVPDTHHAGNGRRNLILGMTAAVVTALAVGGVQYARISNAPTVATPTSNLATAVQVQDAYVPGGSVYNEQVPAAAQPDLSAYSNGGSIYSQQVPAAAQPDLSAYSNGGSIYSQQVPAAVGSDLSAYAPGGSVYTQQVPQQ